MFYLSEQINFQQKNRKLKQINVNVLYKLLIMCLFIKLFQLKFILFELYSLLIL